MAEESQNEFPVSVSPEFLSDYKKVLERTARLTKEQIHEEFGPTVDAYISAGIEEKAAYGMVRLQIASLMADVMTEAYVKDHAFELVSRSIEALLRLMSVMASVLFQYRKRLRNLEVWRFATLGSINDIAGLLSRVSRIEQNAIVPDVGPELVTTTSGAGAFEICRIPMLDLVGPQRRKLSITATNTAGTAYYFAEWHITGALVSGAAVLRAGLASPAAVTSAAVVSAAASGTYIALSTTGEAGADMVWRVQEVRNLLGRVDPTVNPIYKA